eukprot:PhF_6_TR2232/c0_g1_i2/m.3756
MNSTLLIIKPHASSSLILRERIRSMITDNGFTIVAEGIYDSRVLKKKRLLDMYFGDFASFGSSVPPSALTVDSHVKADFQRWSPNKDSWDAAVMEGRVLNGVDAIKYFGESATAWDLCAEARSSPHFIISSQISVYHLSSIDSGDNHKPLYVLNATYPYIRDSFLDKNNTTPWFEIEWPSSQLSWHDFKHEFVGSKDPQSAAANSIRGVVFRSWKTFELESEPDSLHNVVRVSAGPLQSLYERIKWFGITPAMDETLGRHLGKGMGSKYVDWALTNPFILHPTRGNRMFLFDQTRSMDAPECLEYLTVHGKGCWNSIVNGIGSPPAAPVVSSPTTQHQSTADRQAPPSRLFVHKPKTNGYGLHVLLDCFNDEEPGSAGEGDEFGWGVSRELPRGLNILHKAARAMRQTQKNVLQKVKEKYGRGDRKGELLTSTECLAAAIDGVLMMEKGSAGDFEGAPGGSGGVGDVVLCDLPPIGNPLFQPAKPKLTAAQLLEKKANALSEDLERLHQLRVARPSGKSNYTIPGMVNIAPKLPGATKQSNNNNNHYRKTAPPPRTLPPLHDNDGGSTTRLPPVPSTQRKMANVPAQPKFVALSVRITMYPRNLKPLH